MAKQLNSKNLQTAIFKVTNMSIFFFDRVENIAGKGFNCSVGSIQDLRTGGCWFDPDVGQYSFVGLMIIERIHSSLTAVQCLHDGYVGKQLVAWK